MATPSGSSPDDCDGEEGGLVVKEAGEALNTTIPNPRVASGQTVDLEDASHVESEKAEDSATLALDDDQIPKPSIPRLSPARNSSQFWTGIVKWRNKYLQATWAGEIMLGIFSQACIIGLVVVLAEFDNRPLADWNMVITINTWVQVLSTATTAALAYILSNGISQLKWTWLSKDRRPVQDLDRLDSASRGPYGSQKLLFSLRNYGMIPLSGALITCCLALTAPFSQQVVRYVEKQVPSHALGAAMTPRCTVYDSFSHGFPRKPQPSDYDYFPPNQILAALYKGALTPPSRTINPTVPRCATGDCTWHLYKTLAVCAHTADLTSKLTIKCMKRTDTGTRVRLCQLSLPNGVRMDQVPPASITIRPRSKQFPTMAFQESGIHFANFFVLWFRDLDNHNQFGAKEISLRPCIQTLNTSVTTGLPQTKVLGSQEQFKWTYHEGWTSMPPGSSEKYIIRANSFGALANSMYTYWSGDWPLNDATSAVLAAVSQPPYDGEGLEAMVRNVATSLSNGFREEQRHQIHFEGTALTKATYIQVRWPWLAMIFFVTLGGNLFLVLVIRANRKTHNPLWKSSSVALLRALDRDQRPQEFVGLLDTQTMAAEAKEVYIQLHSEEGKCAWKLKSEALK